MTTLPTTCNEATLPTPPSRVSFSTIEIHEHEVCLGDNPGGTLGGPPLAVDWKAVSHIVLDVNEYEANRVQAPRCAEELLLPEVTRITVLQEWGYTIREIRQLSRPVHIARAQRQATRLKYANGQRPLDMTVKDVVMNILSLGCHAKKIREKQQLLLEDEDESVGSASRRFSQAQDVVMHHTSQKKLVRKVQVVPQVEMNDDKNDDNTTVIMDTSLTSSGGSARDV